VNRRGPKVKLARQLGIALTPKAARVMERRPNPPGQHGASPRRKVSGYKKQLVEKQRLRAQYNVSERQLQNAFAQAIRQTGNTGVRLLQLLELRLDAVVLRAGFVRTIYAARQAVSHGHVTVNGKRVNIPSYLIRAGDVVAVVEAGRQMVRVLAAMEAAQRRGVPEWIEVDRDSVSGKVKYLPTRSDITAPINEKLVVELYSK